MKNSIGKKAADTNDKVPMKVRIGKEEFQVASPTMATVIVVSEMINKLPYIDKGAENIYLESLRVAKDYTILGDILAALILGAKEESSKSLFPFLRKRKISRSELARKAMDNLSPKEASELIVVLINKLELGSFYVVASTIYEQSLTRPTKEGI